MFSEQNILLLSPDRILILPSIVHQSSLQNFNISNLKHVKSECIIVGKSRHPSTASDSTKIDYHVYLGALFSSSCMAIATDTRLFESYCTYIQLQGYPQISFVNYNQEPVAQRSTSLTLIYIPSFIFSSLRFPVKHRSRSMGLTLLAAFLCKSRCWFSQLKITDEHTKICPFIISLRKARKQSVGLQRETEINAISRKQPSFRKPQAVCVREIISCIRAQNKIPMKLALADFHRCVHFSPIGSAELAALVHMYAHQIF